MITNCGNHIESESNTELQNEKLCNGDLFILEVHLFDGDFKVVGVSHRDGGRVDLLDDEILVHKRDGSFPRIVTGLEIVIRDECIVFSDKVKLVV